MLLSYSEFMKVNEMKLITNEYTYSWQSHSATKNVIKSVEYIVCSMDSVSIYLFSKYSLDSFYVPGIEERAVNEAQVWPHESYILV